MVVVFPLLIIGSAFAAYYSINASVNVSIYKGLYSSQSASASVVYNSKANTETFEISGSHAKVITLKANATGYEFKGWFNGTEQSYKEAEIADEVKYFNTEKELNVKLSDYENILAVYEIIPFTITYNVNGTTKSQTTKGTTTLQDPAQAAQDAGLGAAETGKKWAWVDEDGNVITTAEADITVTLDQVAVEYTITVAGGEGISYTGSAVKVKYDDASTKLEEIFKDANYTKTLAFKSFASVKYGENTYTDAAVLLAAIKTANANADATITLTPIVSNTFDKITVTTLKYRAFDAVENLDDAIVYNGEDVPYEIEHSEVEDRSNQTLEATETLDNWLKIFSTKFYLDAESNDRVEAYEIDLTINGAIVRVLSFNSTTTINDVLAYAYSKIPTKMATTVTNVETNEQTNVETLTISEVLVKLA
jgi:hypothetical protein